MRARIPPAQGAEAPGAREGEPEHTGNSKQRCQECPACPLSLSTDTSISRESRVE